MVYSVIEEEILQVSVWPVCMDTYDTHCCVYPVCVHCSQHIWRDILVTWLLLNYLMM